MFGGLGRTTGVGLLSELWEWDGSTWVELFPAVSPPPMASHTMAYDERRECLVVFGSNTPSETWEFDGVAWTQVALTLQPEDRWSAAMVYDEARYRVVMTAGNTSSGIFDTWVYGITGPATVSPRGIGCSGATSSPVLEAHGKPSLGNPSFAIDVHHGPPNALVGTLVSANAAATPIGNGCTMYVGLSTVIAVPGTTNAAGFSSMPLPIPPADVLVDLPLYAQALVLDPPALGGFAFTAAIDLTVGD